MPIVISSNVPALKVQNVLSKATANLSKSLERLSSGYRINHASDDPAGLYFAAGLNSQIRGIKTASQNVQLGYNMISVAEGDLVSINDNLMRLKDLALQMSNGILSDEQAAALKDEAQQRVDEINRIANSSQFNNVNLLDGSIDDGVSGGVRLQVGSGSSDVLYIKDVFTDSDTEALGLFGSGGGKFKNIEEAFASSESASKFIEDIDNAMNNIAQKQSTAGAYQNRLESVENSLATQNENLTAAYSTVMDTDIAEETVNFTKNQILQQTSAALFTQITKSNALLALSLLPQ